MRLVSCRDNSKERLRASAHQPSEVPSRVKPHRFYSGAALREVFREGAHWLEKNVHVVNNLNVFPVPDGDTGTNMSLTMRSALEAADQCADPTAAELAEAMAHGALLGARGNGGVILSQVLRGLAQGLAGKAKFDGHDLALALGQASDCAYRAMAQPAEGTILTVMRSAAEAAMAADTPELEEALAKALTAAQAALADTPSLLPVLKEAGVVDAGGQGLVLLFEGALAQLQGRALSEGYRTLGDIDASWLQTTASLHAEGTGETWGYCTQFLIKGGQLSQEEVRQGVNGMGSSVLVVGDPDAVQVHLHTQDPGPALSFGASLGSLHSIKIDNMQEQSAALLKAQKVKAAPPTIPVVAVVPGEGLGRVFLSIGATEIVSGGQSMNPSTRELAEKVNAINADTVLLLPNNPNVVPACQQVQQLTAKRAPVVPSKTIPQGIAALLSINQQKSLDDNVQAMTESLESVRSVEVTAATRSVLFDGLQVQQGHYVGLLDRQLVATSESPVGTIEAVLDKLALSPGCLITLYYGEMVTEGEASALASALRKRPDRPEIEMVQGGQPHYLYFASIES